MKRLSLNGLLPDRLRLREEARPGTCSTIEAIAGALALLEGDEGARIGDLLQVAFARMTRASLSVRGHAHRIAAFDAAHEE